MKNKMSDLRNHLFETLEALKDEEKPMDLKRAKAISEVAQTIINSAKVEVEFAKAIGASTSTPEFFGGTLDADDKPRLAAADEPHNADQPARFAHLKRVPMYARGNPPREDYVKPTDSQAVKDRKEPA